MIKKISFTKINSSIVFLLYCVCFFSSMKAVIDNISEQRTFSMLSEDYHTKFYICLMHDYAVLFEEAEKNYKFCLGRNIASIEMRALCLQENFIFLSKKIAESLKKIMRSKENIHYLCGVLKRIVDDEVIKLNRHLRKEILIGAMHIFEEMLLNYDRLNQYDDTLLLQYIQNKLFHAFSLECEFLKKFHNDDLQKSFEITEKILFWVIYMLETAREVFLEKNKNVSISDSEIFLYMYPLHEFSLDQTYKKIQFEETLGRHLPPKTREGKSYTQRRKFAPFLDQDMAYDLISRETTALNEAIGGENELVLKEIETIYYSKIVPILHELVLIEEDAELSLLQYFHSFIPPLFPLKGSKQSSKLSFGCWSLFQQYVNPGIFLFAKNALESVYSKSETKKPFFNSPLMMTLGAPLIALWPGRSEDTVKLVEKIEQRELGIKLSLLEKNKEISKNRFALTLEESTELSEVQKRELKEKYNAIIGQDIDRTVAVLKADLDEKGILRRESILESMPKITLGDQIDYLKYGKYNFSYFLQKHPLFLYSAAITGKVFQSFLTGYLLYQTGSNLVKQFKQTLNNNKYLLLQRKLILYTRKIMTAYEKIINSEKSNPYKAVPEFLALQNVYLKKDSHHVFNAILDFNKNIISSIYNGISQFIAPGISSHFYFNKIENNTDLKLLRLFLGYIETFLTKAALLKKTSYEKSMYMFSIPELIENKESASLYIKDMWFTTGIKNPTKNSILFDESSRNMLLVSPVAGGKTVFLSTLLANLYLANFGIVAANAMKYTYFFKIIDHLTHDYIIGGELSQHLAERASMELVEKIVEKNSQNKLIVFIDEIFRGTRPDLAIEEAFLRLPKILKMKNTITVITTHFPEIVELTKKPDLSLNLYYLIVDHISGKFFRRFLLSRDDDNNWWIRNSSLAMAYQQSLADR